MSKSFLEALNQIRQITINEAGVKAKVNTPKPKETAKETEKTGANAEKKPAREEDIVYPDEPVVKDNADAAKRVKQAQEKRDAGQDIRDPNKPEKTNKPESFTDKLNKIAPGKPINKIKLGKAGLAAGVVGAGVLGAQDDFKLTKPEDDSDKNKSNVTQSRSNLATMDDLANASPGGKGRPPLTNPNSIIPTGLPRGPAPAPKQTAPQARSQEVPAVKSAEPAKSDAGVDKNATSKKMFQSYNDAVASGQGDNSAAFFAASAQRKKEDDEKESGGKKKMNESKIINAFLRLMEQHATTRVVKEDDDSAAAFYNNERNRGRTGPNQFNLFGNKPAAPAAPVAKPAAPKAAAPKPAAPKPAAPALSSVPKTNVSNYGSMKAPPGEAQGGYDAQKAAAERTNADADKADQEIYGTYKGTAPTASAPKPAPEVANDPTGVNGIQSIDSKGTAAKSVATSLNTSPYGSLPKSIGSASVESDPETGIMKRTTPTMPNLVPPGKETDPETGLTKTSSEEESGGKTKGKKSMKESTLIDAALSLIGKENMFESAKKAKKDWDGDGKIESEKDEVWGSRFKAAKKAGKMEEELKGNQNKIDANHNGKIDKEDFKILRGKKKMEEAATSSDPDFAAPRPGGEKKKGEVEFKPTEPPKDVTPQPKNPPVPPKRSDDMKEDVEFSEAELAHLASIIEADAAAYAPTDANKNYKVNAKGSERGTGPTAGDLTDETVIDEARGRPKGSKKDDVNPNTQHGRDPRQHIQVIAGQAMGGRVMDFKHDNGQVSKITPPMGRRIVNHLGDLKPAEKQKAVIKMHHHPEGLKV